MSKRIPSQWYWPKVDTSAGPDLCWPWVGTRDRAGYGTFDAQPGIRSAHRFAYFLAHGEIPEGMCVLHRCDNPPCQNPGHLFLGTQADNMADMASKGRGANGIARHPELVKRGADHWARLNPERIPRGSNTASAKLDEEAVREIRSLVSNGVQQKDLATRYGISPAAVSLLVARKTWGHVA